MPVDDALKHSLVKLFKNEPVDALHVEFPSLSKNERIEDVQTSELVPLLAPFVEAYRLLETDPGECKANLVCFIDGILALGINDAPQHALEKNAPMLLNDGGSLFDRHTTSIPGEVANSLSEIWNNAKNGRYNRGDKIRLQKEIREFRYDFIDWEDREYLLGMLRYALCRSIQMYNWLENEERVKAAADEKDEFGAEKQTNAYKVWQCGHTTSLRVAASTGYAEESVRRSDVLRRSNNPTMTLEEYGDMVLADMQSREAKALNSKSAAEEGIEEYDDDRKEEDSRRKAIRNDSINDEKRSNLGNIKKMG